MKEKERMRICHRSEDTKETQKLKAICDPASNTGPEKGHQGKHCLNPNKVCSLVNNILPTFMSQFFIRALWLCKMLTLEQAKRREYGNSLYYFSIFSVGLKLFLNEKVLKNFLRRKAHLLEAVSLYDHGQVILLALDFLILKQGQSQCLLH